MFLPNSGIRDSSHPISASPPDVGGTESPRGPALNVTVVTVVSAPILPDLCRSDDSGVSDSDNVTRVRDARLDVTAGEAGTVHLDVDGAARPLPLAGAGTDTLTGPPAWISRTVNDSNALLAVVPADMNGDGTLEVVCTTIGCSSVNDTTVMLGTGDGRLQSPTVRTADAGDVDGDGHRDFVIAGQDGSSRIMLGNSDGTFRQGALFSTPSNSWDVTTADFDSDVRDDFATPYLGPEFAVLQWRSGAVENITWTLGNLSPLATRAGTYTLSFKDIRRQRSRRQ